MRNRFKALILSIFLPWLLGDTDIVVSLTNMPCGAAVLLSGHTMMEADEGDANATSYVPKSKGETQCHRQAAIFTITNKLHRRWHRLTSSSPAISHGMLILKLAAYHVVSLLGYQVWRLLLEVKIRVRQYRHDAAYH